MPLVVNTNAAANNSQRHLGINNAQLTKSLERLSSGLRINKAADDAAGLAIATKLNAQVKGLNQAVRNANNAISLVQTAEGGVNTLTNILQRLRELAVQSASDDNTATDRANLKSEADSLVSELTRIVNTSEFNTLPLLDGSFSGKFFQIGANYKQNLSFEIEDARAKALGKRATVTGQLTDGAANGINANIATGELTINNEAILTSAGDDQVSVSEIRAMLSASFNGTQTGYATISAATFVTISPTVVQKDDNGNMVSIVASIAGSASGGTGSITASLTIGDYGTTITTTFASAASIDLISSYVSVNMIATAGSMVANASYTAASLNQGAASLSGNSININGTWINYTADVTADTNAASLASYVSGLVNAINSASIQYVSARRYSGSTTLGASGIAWTLIATKGKDLTLYSAAGSIASNLGLEGSFVGSGVGSTVVVYNGQSSAIGKAAAVNVAKGNTKVSATADTNTVTGSTTIGTVSFGSGAFVINGVDVGVVSGGASDLITAINSKTADTGVTASLSNGKLKLSASDGRNISVWASVEVNTTLGIGGLTNANNINRGSVTLNSTSDIAVTGTRPQELGNGVSAQTYSSDLTNNVSLVDISTQSGAQNAILSVDAALDQLNRIRANIGAIQNRLEFTVANLEIASENFGASESRIKDADFAFETAKFTRNQILVQAGTAMLAQANTLPQIALQLLR